jgi:hypothetical protein
MAKTPDDAGSLARADGYNAQTGQVNGREAAALKWIEQRRAQLQSEGLPLEGALKKAFAEARENDRMDWRVGGK